MCDMVSSPEEGASPLPVLGVAAGVLMRLSIVEGEWQKYTMLAEMITKRFSERSYNASRVFEVFL